MFQLDEVSKQYGSLTALDRCELSLETARTTVLIGPSGCGKSTVLRLMIGLQAPDAGSVRFAGEPLDAKHLPRLRQRMGYVIQDGGLFPHLTARDNVTLMARHLGWEDARIEPRIAELAERKRLQAQLEAMTP